jgi:hypothetical protein
MYQVNVSNFANVNTFYAPVVSVDMERASFVKVRPKLSRFLKKVMILIDRIIRILKKDIYLPMKCYANKRQLTNPRDCCKCKNFCRKPPSGGDPVYVKIAPKYGREYNYTK